MRLGVKDTLQRLGQIWTGMSTNNRVLVVLVAAGLVVAATVTVRWANQAMYTTLYTNLSPEEGGEIVDKLASLGVPYRISAGGTAILVPEASVQSTRLKMAAQGYPHGGMVGYEIFDKSNLGMTEFLQKVNYRRALEGELAKSIMSLNEVAAARVHLMIPEQRLFARDQKEPTASVVVKLSRPLTKGQVSGIAHLVAASVEGLTTDRIAIVDYEGTLLSGRAGDDSDALLSSSQLELRKNVEHYLENKAQSMLDGTLGSGRSVVRVIADLNFDKVEKSSESYDPNRAAIRSEETGRASNSTTTNYAISKSVERVVSAFGNIERLSVAVIVDGTYAPALTPNTSAGETYRPRSDEELQQIQALVETAVGFDSTRSDHIEVVNMAFATGSMEETQTELDAVSHREFYYDLGKKVFYAVLALLALFYVHRIFRRLGEAIQTATPPRRPEPMTFNERETASVSPGSQRRRAEALAERAQGKPEEVAKTIKTMMLE